jgi:hypothetical protein
LAHTRTPADWTTEDAYWREHYTTRPYWRSDRDYDFYSSGYRFGFDATDRYKGKAWGDVEAELQRDWDQYKYRGESTWEQVKIVVKDAWDRVVGNS